MRKAKLWSVLCAAVLLCACVVGLTFTGAAATDSRIPTATTTYVVGTDGDTIRACLEKAADETWSKDAVLEIRFTGTDDSVVLTEATSGASTNLLFGQTTIFREDNTRLPIVIRGTASNCESNVISWNHGATSTATKSFAGANDYTFVNLLFPLGNTSTGKYATLYAGSGNLAFEDVLMKESNKSWGSNYMTSLYADNFTMDAYYGWDAEKIAANKNSDGLIPTSLTMGRGAEYFPANIATLQPAAVGFTPAGWTIDTSSVSDPAEKIRLAKEQAAEFTYNEGQLLTECDVRPIHTQATVIIDTCTEALDNEGTPITVGEIGAVRARQGDSPVAHAIVEMRSGIVGRINADDHTTDSVQVGDSTVNFRGGSVGFVANNTGIPGIRMIKCTLYGDVALNISEDSEYSTAVRMVQYTNSTSVKVYGTAYTEMTGGHIIGYGGNNGYRSIQGAQGGINRLLGGRIDIHYYGASYTSSVSGYVPADKIPAEYRSYIGENKVGVLNILGEDMVLGGTYYGGQYNANGTVPGYVVNVVEGATFEKTFYGGNGADNTSVDGIINIVKDGKFTVFAGGGYKKVVHHIVNYIEGGNFGRNSSGISAYLGIFEDGGSTDKGIENYISGGTFTGYILCGNRTLGTVSNSRVDGEGNPLPAIYNRISGGTFSGIWGAGCGAITGDVVTDISGGEFHAYNDNPANYPYGFIAGLRNSGTHKTGDLITNISGGTFLTRVNGGTPWGTVPAEKNAGDIQLNISGGTFNSEVFANSSAGDSGDHYTSSSLTVDLTENDVVFLGPVGHNALINRNGTDSENVTVSVIGGEGKMFIGQNSGITADSLTGKLVVEQTEGWLAHDYVKLPANSQYEVKESPEIFGSYTADDTILVKGDAISAKGATLRLGERLGVRILLNQADVDAYGEAFTYTVKLGDTKIATGGYAEIVENNYSILFDGIGLSQFGETFTVESTTMADIEYSVADLATVAKDAWTDADWKAYAEAILELHAVYSAEAANKVNTVLPDYNSASVVPSAAKGAADDIASANVALLMGDAAGIRLSVTLNNAPVNAKIVVGEKELAAKVDGNTIIADVYFAHEYLADAFTVSVQTDAGEHMTYTASIEALAKQLAQNENNEFQKNAIAFLNYVQKAVACK